MNHRCKDRMPRRGGWLLAALLAVTLAGCGPSANQLESPYKSELDDVSLHKTFAVLPILNQTGKNEIASENYDVQAVFVGQLQQVRGLQVLPMQRVRAYLANKGQVAARTPRQVIQMARELGVDGVIVAAVTRFDPYEPPTVGMTIALFRRPTGTSADAVDPILLSRRPTLLTSESRQTKLVNQQVFQFDARNADVIERVKAFAKRRGGSVESPWGWRRYVVSAKEYLTFCSYEAIRTLLKSEAEMLAAAKKSSELGVRSSE